MPGGTTAVSSGASLEQAVSDLASELGLQVTRQARVGRRLWGAERFIDLVLRRDRTHQALGVECKYQGGARSAEKKMPETIQDISAWPIARIVVFAGAGFSANMRSYLYSTGKAVDFADLEDWLRLFFGSAASEVS